MNKMKKVSNPYSLHSLRQESQRQPLLWKKSLKNCIFVIGKVPSRIPSADLKTFLDRASNYNNKPFLASGVTDVQFEFGQVIWINNRFTGFAGRHKETYEVDTAPKAIVIRETKQNVFFIDLESYIKERLPMFRSI